jgi:hypothetical protein
VFHPLTQLCTNTCPVLNPIEIHPKPLFLTTGNRIKKSDPLNSSTITWLAAIRYYNVVERTFFGTASCQSDLYLTFSTARIAVQELAGLRKPRILTPFATKENNSLQVF